MDKYLGALLGSALLFVGGFVIEFLEALFSVGLLGAIGPLLILILFVKISGVVHDTKKRI